MDKDNEKIYDKLKKILNIFNNNPDTEEAQTALMKAQQLCAKYGLDISNIDFDKKLKADDIVHEYADSEPKKRMPAWEKRLMNIIADNFRCFTYISFNVFNEKLVKFVGRKTDVEFATKIYPITIDYIKNSFKRYYKDNEDYYLYNYRYDIEFYGLTKVKAGIKNTYIDSFLSGLNDKFKENLKSISLENKTNKNELVTTSLVLAKDSELEKYYEDFSEKNLKTTSLSGGIKPNYIDDPSATNSGYLAGYNYGNDTNPDNKIEEKI